MKNVFVLLTVLFIVSLAIIYLKNFFQIDSPIPGISTPIASSPPADLTNTLVSFNNQNYQVELIEVEDLSSVDLIPNFENPKTVKDIIKENSCVFGVNGGFYTTANQPIGLFISQGKQLAGKKDSQLFDTIVAVTNQNNLVFTNEVNLAGVRLAVQVGPTLRKNSQQVNLSIRNDKSARRMVVAKTASGKLIFLTFFDPQSTFKGPFLADLPQILDLGLEKLKISVDTAANLDGGSASAFYTPDLSLEELSLVGSFFCIKTAN